MTEGAGREDRAGLNGKVAIVTGGGAADDGIGNGRAAAILLARAGAKVLVVDLDRGRAERTVAMISEEGGTAAPFVADVTDERQASAMVAEALAQFGRLDCLDNNVGIGGRGQIGGGGPPGLRPLHKVKRGRHFLGPSPPLPALQEAAGGRATARLSPIFCPCRPAPDAP